MKRYTPQMINKIDRTKKLRYIKYFDGLSSHLLLCDFLYIKIFRHPIDKAFCNNL